MKKLLTLTLAVLMLLTALVGCNDQPVTPPNDDTQTEQPDNNNPGGTTDPGTDIPQQPALKDDEIEKTTEHVVGNGKFVFYEHKYDYAGGQIVLMDMKNETDSNYDVKIHATYYDENGTEILTETRTIPAVAAGYQTPVLLWPQTAFATYSYTLETTPYDGVCWGENLMFEYSGFYEGVSNKGYDKYPSLFGVVKETNRNNDMFYRCATIILFDNTGSIYGLYPFETTRVYTPYTDKIHHTAFLVYQHLEGEMVCPENLTGDLRCVIIPYFADNNVDIFWNSDKHKLIPDCPPPIPHP